MIENNKWVPEIPRPNVEQGELFEEFVANWIKINYSELCDEEDPKNLAFYQDIISNWSGSDEDFAEELIKYHGWSYSEAKKFEEKSFSFDLDKEQERLETIWLKENHYTCPFPVGSKVKIKYRMNMTEGIIQEDVNHYHDKYGKALVLIEEHKIMNEINKKKRCFCSSWRCCY